MAQPPTFGSGEAASKVDITISCQNLKDLDYFSKSDPCVFLFEYLNKNWVRIGRTEVIDNNLSPKFSKAFQLQYRFEEIQRLKFVVVDVDDKNRIDDLSKHDKIGELECTLADLVTAGLEYERTLRLNGAPRGKIKMQTEEVTDSKFSIAMQLSASKLDKKDFFGKSDPFVEISKVQEGGGYTVVYRSNHIAKTLDPAWPRFELPIQKLCSGDWDRGLRFSVFDWNRSGDHELIGLANITLREITPERGGKVFNLDLVDPEKKKRKKKYVNSGVLHFRSIQAIPLHSFTDYIRGGCQINLMLAIDFTGSNGKQDNPNSLHFISAHKENEYQRAIREVASVLAPYDSDQMIPVYGFGARLPPDGQVSHCFPINFNYNNPEIYGVQGILDVYRHALSQVQLYGPTNFSSFLDKAVEMSVGSMTQDTQNYFILLVITDGVITDMPNTIDRIVQASNLPLSIVIVGVGGADFSNMEVLDADDTPLRSRQGELMKRDIVQFVPFRELSSKSGANFSIARETLAEIPEQLTSYMKAKRIIPNPPPLRHRQSTFMHQSGGPPPPGANVPQPPPPGGSPYQSRPAEQQYPAASYPTGGGQPPPYPTGAPAPYPTGPPSTAGYPTQQPTTTSTAPPPYPI